MLLVLAAGFFLLTLYPPLQFHTPGSSLHLSRYNDFRPAIVIVLCFMRNFRFDELKFVSYPRIFIILSIVFGICIHFHFIYSVCVPVSMNFCSKKYEVSLFQSSQLKLGFIFVCLCVCVCEIQGELKQREIYLDSKTKWKYLNPTNQQNRFERLKEENTSFFFLMHIINLDVLDGSERICEAHIHFVSQALSI